MLPLTRKIYSSLVPPAYSFDMILDVGANVGQTFKRLRENFPEATVHSFEPIESTYEILKGVVAEIDTSSKSNVHCLAAGDEPGEVKVYLKDLHSQNSLADGVNKAKSEDAPHVVVKVVRLTDFAAQQNIRHIDILKLDVEGFEIPALRGASALLQDRVSFVVAEVNFSVTDKRQSYFGDVEQFLKPFGFTPVGIYDVHYRERDGRLDYCDAVFVNQYGISRKAK